MLPLFSTLASLLGHCALTIGSVKGEKAQLERLGWWDGRAGTAKRPAPK